MKLLELLKGAKNSLEEVEKILDEVVREWDRTHMDDYSLATEVTYLVTQIGNVAESARDFKKHMVEVRH
jgi:hypothetical protein